MITTNCMWVDQLSNPWQLKHFDCSNCGDWKILVIKIGLIEIWQLNPFSIIVHPRGRLNIKIVHVPPYKWNQHVWIATQMMMMNAKWACHIISNNPNMQHVIKHFKKQNAHKGKCFTFKNSHITFFYHDT